MMVLALGVMGLAPNVFWAMTLPEFDAALEGFKEFHCAKEETQPLGRTEMEEMMRRFPDEPLPRHAHMAQKH